MARITVEDCLVQENNRFSLVQLCSKRTKQLLGGSTVQVTDRRNKAVVTALREIAGGKVRFMSPEEALEFAEQQAREAEAARIAAEAQRERRPEVGAGLFTPNGGNDTRSSAFVRDALMATPAPAATGDDDEE